MHVAPTLSACKQGRAQVLPFLDVQLPINPCGEPVASIEVRCWFQTYGLTAPVAQRHRVESTIVLCACRKRQEANANGTNHERHQSRTAVSRYQSVGLC